LPVSNIEAHGAKIYGIDWSPDRRNEIVTCSLDRTIKVFDVQMEPPDGSSVMNHPKITFQSSYPVWRARNLPFGRGILSLPQRGENKLEMYAHDNLQTPVQTFEGHTDVVKEFVWRRGGQGKEEKNNRLSLEIFLNHSPFRLERLSTHYLVEGQNFAFLAGR
jgi:WD repeat-containing protein 59